MSPDHHHADSGIERPDARGQVVPVPVPRPRPGGRTLPSPAWLVPIAALVMVVVIAWQAQAQRGPTIRIWFHEGHGVQPGDPLSMRGVRVGEVRQVVVSRDLQRVEVVASLVPQAENLAAQGSRFWIVRPEVSLRGVSGLDTLLGPRYIECAPPSPPSPASSSASFPSHADAGAGAVVGNERSPAPPRRAFVFEGLSAPPGFRDVEPGSLRVTLRADTRGSLAPGSPVLYRGLRVGEVHAFELSDDSTHVRVSAVIEPRYAPLVRENSVFWDTSGFGVDFGVVSGLSLRAASLESLLTGGVSFATPAKPGKLVQSAHEFQLAAEPPGGYPARWSPSIPLNDAALDDR